MAQNISLWGATYSNVPALDVPKSPSGTARFCDPSVTTATAPDVTAGKYFLDSSGNLTEGTGTGGGGGGEITQDANGYLVLSKDGGGGGGGSLTKIGTLTAQASQTLLLVGGIFEVSGTKSTSVLVSSSPTSIDVYAISGESSVTIIAWGYASNVPYSSSRFTITGDLARSGTYSRFTMTGNGTMVFED